MSGFTILLVEDNPGDAFLIKELLRQVEIPVGELITHTHLLPALADVDEKEIDLILLDLTLPDSQGLTTVSTMCERANGLPVVVLTGLEDDELGFKAIALGVQDYMSKNDLSKNSLNRTLRYALERYALSIEREKLIRELDAFSHTVAHDLKGPLGILMGHASMMQEYGEMLPSSERKVSVDTIVNYCQKMNNIIDELMLLAHVRDKDVQSVPISMQRTVQDAIIRLQPMIDEYGGRIERVMQMPCCLGYEPWLEEVWVNFLSNALKYGGDPPQIRIDGRTRSDGTISYWIEDNGRGLTEKEMKKLFVPFTRLEQIKVSGQGLGLSIVHRIITKLHGTVFVRSVPGQGSCFGFTLPGCEP